MGVIAAAIVLFVAAPAVAHSSLIDSNPADGAVLSAMPTQFELTFNEPLDDIGAGLALRRDGGEPIRLEAIVDRTALRASAPATADDGTYTLAWRVVSEDGHPIDGVVRFSIGDGAADPIDASSADGQGQGQSGAVLWLVVLAAVVLSVFVLGFAARRSRRT